MPHRTYRSAADFRRALEDRLQDIAKREAVDLQRVRREVAFDRLLIRLFRGERPEKMPWALKGGYAMELRIQSARATKDIDLTVRIAGSANDALLQEFGICSYYEDSRGSGQTAENGAFELPDSWCKSYTKPFDLIFARVKTKE